MFGSASTSVAAPLASTRISTLASISWSAGDRWLRARSRAEPTTSTTKARTPTRPTLTRSDNTELWAVSAHEISLLNSVLAVP
jgi:hypothetical protein